MKKLESTFINMILVLTSVAVLMGLVLAYMNHLTATPIALQKNEALQEGIKNVMASNRIEVTSTDTLHQCDAKGKDQVFIIYHNKKGAAVESTTLGFGGPLKVLVGFNAEGTILGYTILEHQETPGLGAKADQWFQEGQNGCIIGMTPADSLYVKKDGGQVDAITASTITSRAFLLAVNNAYKAYLGLKN